MTRTEPWISWMLVTACALWVASCESTTRVGSECRHGVCPQANAATAPACLTSSTVGEISVTRVADETLESPTIGSICLPRQLPLDSQGHAACRVLWELAAGNLPCDGKEPCYGEGDSGEQILIAPAWNGSCSDLPFLSPAGEGGSNVCEVQQITADEAASGEKDGWFLDDSIEGDCFADGPGIAPTLAARPRTGVIVKVACSRVQAAGSDGELADVDPSECGEPPAGVATDLGAACLPAAGPAEFDEREAYVETPSQACETGSCLVYRLRGNAEPDCEPCKTRATQTPGHDGFVPQCIEDGGVRRCASEEAIEAHAYCSCRCDAPDGDPGPFCDCADGFSCVDVLPDGPQGVRGSYCVRDGTFTKLE